MGKAGGNNINIAQSEGSDHLLKEGSTQAARLHQNCGHHASYGDDDAGKTRSTADIEP